MNYLNAGADKLSHIYYSFVLIGLIIKEMTTTVDTILYF